MPATPPATDRAVKAPADRLPTKRPRTVTVGIYLDDQLAIVHDHAVAAHQQLEQDLIASRARRTAERQLTGDLTPGEAAELVLAEDGVRLAEAHAAVEEALAALEDGTQWFVFQGIGSRRFRDMVKAHPPSDEDRADHARTGGTGEPEYSPEGLMRDLVPACCVSPKASAAEWAERVFDSSKWNAVELAALFAAAINANQSVRTVTHRPPPRWPS